MHRVDCSQDDTIPQHWEIGRRYHEFYVLQSKLAEFHGEFGDDCRLPPKKTFATKDLEFIEKSRLEDGIRVMMVNGGTQVLVSASSLIPNIKIGPVALDP